MFVFPRIQAWSGHTVHLGHPRASNLADLRTHPKCSQQLENTLHYLTVKQQESIKNCTIHYEGALGPRTFGVKLLRHIGHYFRACRCQRCRASRFWRGGSMRSMMVRGRWERWFGPPTFLLRCWPGSKHGRRTCRSVEAEWSMERTHRVY